MLASHMKELAKKPSFRDIETKWQKYWKKNNIYKFNPNSKKPIYSIDTPPPYASSDHLHIGHAEHYTQFEILARYRKMSGFNVYFPPCFDNNGMPTERYVEKKYNIKKGDISRSEFIKLCRKASKEAEKNFSERFFNALGFSYDWDLMYTTIDPESQKVSQTSFLELVNKGAAYRSEEPTLWCPHCQTALAQAEVENSPRDTKLNWIYFELEDGKKIEIATTRPEFLPATVAVFVNPKDKRYKKYVGKTAKVPLFDLKVPILTDDMVDPTFGSGMMMVCIFGDGEDVTKWRKHKLPLKIMLNKDGTLNELAKKYKGLTLKQARIAILDDLEGQGYFIRDEPLHQDVGLCWRCNTAVEYLVTKQWFLNVLKHKKQVIKFGRKVNWYPKYMRNRLEDWTNNLGWDWCISRQRFYGVPIPVWYCEKCDTPVFAKKKDLPVDPTSKKHYAPAKCTKCKHTKLRPEKDVFDTWMTSSHTPQLASKWLSNPKTYKKVWPMSLRPQAQDIIRTWAFYTIYKNHILFDSIPWKDIFFSPYVLDDKGEGMSKSKGNVIWLKDLLQKYDSADAIRYWVSTAGVGGDQRFKEQEMTRGSKILIKLWNTARFASMHFTNVPKTAKLELVDKWILSRLGAVTKNYHNYFKVYEIAKARKELELFFKNEFCDFYLEMIKYRLYSNRGAAAKFTLKKVLLAILKLWAPILPHITEEIHNTLYSKSSIHLTEFEKVGTIDKKALELGRLACEGVSVIRTWKQKKNMGMGKEVEKLTLSHPSDLSKVRALIASTCRVKELIVKKGKISVR